METFSALLALCAGNSPVPVNSPHKGQWRGALMFTLICARINDWVNNREAGGLRRLLDHYDVSVMHIHDAIWHHNTWATLPQVMIFCLTAQNHYSINANVLSVMPCKTTWGKCHQRRICNKLLLKLPWKIIIKLHSNPHWVRELTMFGLAYISASNSRVIVVFDNSL